MRTKPVVKTYLENNESWFHWICEPCNDESALIYHDCKDAFQAATIHATACGNATRARAISLATRHANDCNIPYPALEMETLYQTARALGLPRKDVHEMITAAKESAQASNSYLPDVFRTFIRLAAAGEPPC